MGAIILTIRHGETAWNREKIFRGIHDVPLNENGRLQARLTARALEAVRIDAAYTSPLSRSVETAATVLNPHGLNAILCDELLDFNYGVWTGKTECEASDGWPKEHEMWRSSPHKARIPGGDNLRDVFGRAFNAMETIAARHENQTVALFAHRVINKLLAIGALGLGLERFPFIVQGNCAINEFERTEQGYRILRINDTAHIRAAGVDLIKADF